MTALAPTSNGEAMTNAIVPHTDDGLSAFVAVRPRLFGIAYRMLGSRCDAEDVVQDVWLRWQTTDRSVVRSVPAFLSTTATRLAINVLTSAHWCREASSEHSSVEPADASADPGVEAERGEALELAMTLLREKLSPSERAAYVLTEAFDYPHARIAEVLRVSHANARQIASRARKRLAAEGPARGSSSERPPNPRRRARPAPGAAGLAVVDGQGTRPGRVIR